jgi:hypothetical protein
MMFHQASHKWLSRFVRDYRKIEKAKQKSLSGFLPVDSRGAMSVNQGESQVIEANGVHRGFVKIKVIKKYLNSQGEDRLQW